MSASLPQAQTRPPLRGTSGQVKRISGGILSKKEGVKKFQALFQRTLELKPNRWKKAADRVWEYFPNDAVVMGIVPDGDEKMKSRVLKYLVKKKPQKGAKNG